MALQVDRNIKENSVVQPATFQSLTETLGSARRKSGTLFAPSRCLLLVDMEASANLVGGLSCFWLQLKSILVWTLGLSISEGRLDPKHHGDAITKLLTAKNRAESAHGIADGALGGLNNAKNNLRHCHWYEKVKYVAVVAAKGTEYTSYQVAIEIVNGVLKACEWVVSDPVYQTAKVGIKACEDSVDIAKGVAGAAMTVANGALDDTKIAARVANTVAQAALRDTQISSQELANSHVAQAALNTFFSSMDSVLGGLKKVVVGASSAFTTVVFTVLEDAVKVAGNATSAIDLAKKTVPGTELVTKYVLSLGDCLVSHADHLLDIKQVHITRSLDGLTNKNNKLITSFDAIIAEKAFKLRLDFTPGKGEDLVKDLFSKIVSDIKHVL